MSLGEEEIVGTVVIDDEKLEFIKGGDPAKYADDDGEIPWFDPTTPDADCFGCQGVNDVLKDEVWVRRTKIRPVRDIRIKILEKLKKDLLSRQDSVIFTVDDYSSFFTTIGNISFALKQLKSGTPLPLINEPETRMLGIGISDASELYLNFYSDWAETVGVDSGE